ncbi:integrase catalytic domain-containing protein [Variovorax ginsengisoli]|uniref:Transposase family protein n=1 Tax=Variovorax ginsengisoli TaxID=363844 RepID=A0ABT8S9F5_9BURK|nr:transposase family protein [Variovorax ginsengisoli]MDN8615687.1 transposase family protein [Variovorax ginsengisoli]MDO1534857.1 transposase family protein [Variovorax ginsengisoli]
MFKEFSRERLDKLLRKYPISDAGREYVEKTLGNGWSQKSVGTTHNTPSTIPCPKMGWTSASATWSREHPATLQRIFDEEVVGYVNQAEPIEIIYDGKNGHKVRTTFRPDFLVFHEHRGVVVEEWRPADFRGRLLERVPGRYDLLADGAYSSHPINEALRPMGIGYSLHFSDEIPQTATLNRRYLFSYLARAASEVYRSRLPELLDRVSRPGGTALADLLSDGIERDTLNWALAQGYIFTDLDGARLSDDPEDLPVFAHAETAKAWIQALRPDGTRPRPIAPGAERKLAKGDVFLFDGVRLTVEFSGQTAIYARDSADQPVELLHSLLAAAPGRLVLPESLTTHPRSIFWNTSAESLIRARRRREILEKIDQDLKLNADEKYSDSTIRRWRNQVEDGKTRGLSALESLIDAGDDKGYSGPHVDATLDKKLTELIDEGIEARPKKNTLEIYFAVEEAIQALGYKMIAKSSFYERVAKRRTPATTTSAEGHKLGKHSEPVHWMLDGDTPIHMERALELVHIDSTLLDVLLKSSLTGEILGRPWLTLAVCAHTRKVVGMHLSFRPPSYISSMLVLLDIVEQCNRLPDAIIHDHGSEFKKKEFAQALNDLEIIRHTRPKSSPRFGAIIERMFGTTTTMLLNGIAGSTQSLKKVRTSTKQTDPSSHSAHTLLDLYVGLRGFFEIFNNRKHSTTLMKPTAAYDQSLQMHGFRLHRTRGVEDVLPILLPTAPGRPRSIDPTRGLTVNYRQYGHAHLTPQHLKGKRVAVKPHAFDPSIVIAHLDRNWIECKAQNHSEISRVHPLVRRAIYEEWLVEQRLVETAGKDAHRKLRKLLEEMTEKAKKNIEYWRDRNAINIMGTAPLPSPEILPDDARNTLANLNQMMKNAIEAAKKSPTLGKLMN